MLELNQTALKSLAQHLDWDDGSARQSALIAGKLFWETPWWNTFALSSRQQLQSIDRSQAGKAGNSFAMKCNIPIPVEIVTLDY